VTVTLLKSDNVQDVATSSDTNGGLGTPNHTCCQFSVSVTAEFTSNGPMAFATYRVPDDFPRPGGGDDALKFRDVYFRFQAPGGGDTKVPLRLIRPPVALIHGLWDNSGAWNAFRPLVTGRDTSDQRFKIVRFGFDDAIGTQISGSNPPYTAKQLGSALANSLGFSYNADRVLVKMEQAIEDFKAGANPEKISVAAIQFDIVAHSMGGDIVRTMPRSTGYLQRKSFGQGIVHKLITIDTPHTGSPVATRLLSTQEDNSCLRDVLAKEGYLAFRAVTLGGRSVPGAVGDLVHAPLSDALQSIATAGPKGIFTSMFAGVLLDFTSLDPRLSRAGAIRLWCWGTPLAQALKSTTWPLVFTDDGSHRNDGIVSHASQRNGSSNVATTEGILHSVGMRELGFAGFAALDPDNIAVSVINVLNRPRGNTTYYSVLNP
jgi:pimeloyl-ACP methyl ester carboxylesterase